MSNVMAAWVGVPESQVIFPIDTAHTGSHTRHYIPMWLASTVAILPQDRLLTLPIISMHLQLINRFIYLAAAPHE